MSDAAQVYSVDTSSFMDWQGGRAPPRGPGLPARRVSVIGLD